MSENAFTVKLRVPRAVNFLHPEDERLGVVSIGDVPDVVLRFIAQQWGEKLIERAKEVRAARAAGKE